MLNEQEISEIIGRVRGRVEAVEGRKRSGDHPFELCVRDREIGVDPLGRNANAVQNALGIEQIEGICSAGGVGGLGRAQGFRGLDEKDLVEEAQLLAEKSAYGGALHGDHFGALANGKEEHRVHSKEQEEDLECGHVEH